MTRHQTSLANSSSAETTADFAWEFLRRNDAYRRAFSERRPNAAELPPAGHIGRVQLAAPDLMAQEWGLCSFRRAGTAQCQSSGRLD